jgi:hypothetical protein
MDYNHAWGASAISVISRFILGVQPSEPGFKRILIAPKPGYIKRISAVVPTQAGSVRIEIDGDRLSVATPSPSTVIWSGRKTELSGNGIITNIN